MNHNDNALKIITGILCLYFLFNSCSQPQTETSLQSQRTSDAIEWTSNNQGFIDELKNQGAKLDVQNYEVYIHPDTWHELTFDAKQKVAEILSRYGQKVRNDDTNGIKIMNLMTGDKMAEWISGHYINYEN